MPILQILLVLIIIGVLLWLINTYIPMDGKVKQILNIVAIIIIVVWLFNVFGLLAYLGSVRV